jgi:putative transposase
MQYEHRRNLPHIYKTGVNYSITFRLYNSIPQIELKKMKNSYEIELKKLSDKNLNSSVFEMQKNELQKEYFESYDTALHNNKINQHLKNKEIAGLVCGAMKYYHEKEYYIDCFCVMPNHVHFVFYYFDEAKKSISQVMQSIKGYTAREANKLLGKKGTFWQSESFDHIIRTEIELKNTINYVIMNPVNAGLVQKWEDWPHMYHRLSSL